MMASLLTRGMISGQAEARKTEEEESALRFALSPCTSLVFNAGCAFSG
jgi:hypothetical protein